MLLLLLLLMMTMMMRFVVDGSFDILLTFSVNVSQRYQPNHNEKMTLD